MYIRLWTIGIHTVCLSFIYFFYFLLSCFYCHFCFEIHGFYNYLTQIFRINYCITAWASNPMFLIHLLYCMTDPYFNTNILDRENVSIPRLWTAKSSVWLLVCHTHYHTHAQSHWSILRILHARERPSCDTRRGTCLIFSCR